MDLLKNVKLCPIVPTDTKVVSEEDIKKTDTQYESTDVVKTVPKTSKSEESNIEVSTEILIPLDPKFSSKMKPDHLPHNIYVSQSTEGEADNLIYKYYVYLNHKSNSSLTFLLNLLEMVNERCIVTLELDNLYINGLDGLSLLSTMTACKAKIIVVGNTITNLMDLAIFATANEQITSKLSYIILTNLKGGAGGNLGDMLVDIEYVKSMEDRIKQLLLSKKMITEEQATEVFTNNKQILLCPKAILANQ